MWTEAAREAALATRRANAAGRKKDNTNFVPRQATEKPTIGRKRGPQTQYKSAGMRQAMALRNKMIHDAGREQRMAAAAKRAGAGAHSGGVGALSPSLRAAGAGLFGTLLGLGGAVMTNAMRNTRGGR